MFSANEKTRVHNSREYVGVTQQAVPSYYIVDCLYVTSCLKDHIYSTFKNVYSLIDSVGKCGGRYLQISVDNLNILGQHHGHWCIIFNSFRRKLTLLNAQYTYHEDVELSRCIRKFAHASCPYSHDMSQKFYQSYKHNVNYSDASSPAALTLHPNKNTTKTRLLHKYLLFDEVKNLYYNEGFATLRSFIKHSLILKSNNIFVCTKLCSFNE